MALWHSQCIQMLRVLFRLYGSFTIMRMDSYGRGGKKMLEPYLTVR